MLSVLSSHSPRRSLLVELNLIKALQSNYGVFFPPVRLSTNMGVCGRISHATCSLKFQRYKSIKNRVVTLRRLNTSVSKTTWTWVTVPICSLVELHLNTSSVCLYLPVPQTLNTRPAAQLAHRKHDLFNSGVISTDSGRVYSKNTETFKLKHQIILKWVSR